MSVQGNLIPPAQYYNYPAMAATALDDQNNIDKWSDLFQRVNDELATDTMEIANLENQVENTPGCSPRTPLTIARGRPPSIPPTTSSSNESGRPGAPERDTRRDLPGPLAHARRPKRGRLATGRPDAARPTPRPPIRQRRRVRRAPHRPAAFGRGCIRLYQSKASRPAASSWSRPAAFLEGEKRKARRGRPADETKKPELRAGRLRRRSVSSSAAVSRREATGAPLRPPAHTATARTARRRARGHKDSDSVPASLLEQNPNLYGFRQIRPNESRELRAVT